MTKTPMATAWAKALLRLSIASIGAGCAGLPDTADQVVTIDTAPRMESTHCIASNSIGSWTVSYVPSDISILRDRKTLLVTCRSAGYHGELYVRPHGDLGVAFFGYGSDVVADTSDGSPPRSPYQGNTSNKANGTFMLYPGLLLVPMKPDR